MAHPTIEQLIPTEAALLNILAWYAPDPIPRFLFDSKPAEAIWLDVVNEQSSVAETTVSLRGTLATLANFHLVMPVDSETIRVQDGVQEAVRSRQVLPAKWLGLALRFLNVARPSADLSAGWGLLQPHIVFSTTEADRRDIDEPTSELMSALAIWLARIGQFIEAEQIQRRALAIDSRNFGPYSTRAARCFSHLARTLLATDRPFEAELMMRRALAIENCYGPDNPRIAECLADLTQVRWPTTRRTRDKSTRQPLSPEQSQSLDQSSDGGGPSVAVRSRQDDGHKVPAKSESESSPTDNVEIKASLDSTDSGQLDNPLQNFSPLCLTGIPRLGRILFATRCVKRIEWSLDCLPDIGTAIDKLILQTLSALEQLNHASARFRIPPRSALHGAIRACDQRKKIAARQIELDLVVSIESVVRFLKALDHAVGTVRARNSQTSIRFAELTAIGAAITHNHRNAQQTDLRALHSATESQGWTEDSIIPAEILGGLWN